MLKLVKFKFSVLSPLTTVPSLTHSYDDSDPLQVKVTWSPVVKLDGEVVMLGFAGAAEKNESSGI